MAAKRGWLSVRLILVAGLAIGMVVSSVLAYQQAPHGSDGILFGFRGGGTTREPATETQAQISIMHTCVFNDDLVLEKVEIYGEGGTPAKTFAVNMTLNSVFWQYELLRAIERLIPIGIGYAFWGVANELSKGMKAESFLSGYFTIDLRQIRQPLTYGEITIIAKATLIHNGERVALEREVIVEYEIW